jgi:hypothetical protein
MKMYIQSNKKEAILQKINLVPYRTSLVSVVVIGCLMGALAGCLLRTDFDPERLAELHWITPPAEAPVVSQPIATVTTGDIATPDPTAIAIGAEEAGQVACEIKVNVTGGEKVYHMPDGAYYDRVKVDEASGDSYACTEEEAIAAGARKSTR